jgi:hypothetical protein
MANTLRFKRGLASGIPTALAGEPLFTTDTFDLYIGNGTTNTRFQKYIASGATTQILRGDGSLYTFPLAISSPSNGQVLKYNGTSWVNDSDAGITGSGANGRVAFWTGTNTQSSNSNLFWDNTNSRLGIGYAGPSTGLDVRGTSNTAASTIQIVGNSVSTLLLGQNADGGIVRGQGGNNVLSFWTGGSGDTGAGQSGTERMRLTTLGNLHIGTFSSDSGEKLQVTGTAKITGAATFGSTISTNGGYFALRSSAASALGYFLQTKDWIGGGSTDANPALATESSYGLNFYTNGSTTLKMRLDTSGNLGLGVTPSAWTAGGKNIEVGSAGNIIQGQASQIAVIQNATFNLGWKYSANGFASFVLQTSGQHQWFNAPSGTAGNAITFTQAMTLDASGRLGVGTTSPQNKLVISNGGAEGLEIGAFANLAAYNRSTSSYIPFTVEAQRFIFSTGNVLIGSTTDSGEKLQVTGTAKITGATAINAGLTVTNTGIAPLTSQVRLVNSTSSNSLISFANTANEFGFGFSSTTTQRFVWINGAPSEIMCLTGTGNLGLGVTPSAWSGTNAFQINQGNFRGDAGAVGISHNAFYNGSSFIYQTSTVATDYYQQSGKHVWQIAGSGTAGNAITFTQAMTLDASGRLGIGTTLPTERLVVRSIGNSYANSAALSIENNTGANKTYLTNANGVFYISNSTTTDHIALYSTGNLVLSGTSDSGEKLQVNGTAKITGATTIGGNLTVNSGNNINLQNASANSTLSIYNSGASGSSILNINSTILATNNLNNVYAINSSGANYGFIINESSTSFSLGYGPTLTTKGTAALTWNTSGAVTIASNLTVDTNTLFVDATNNRVGIGTTSPLSALHVASAMRSQTTFGGSFIAHDGTNQVSFGSYYNTMAVGNSYDGVIYLSNTSGFLSFYLGSSEKARITSNGNFSIGNQNDSYKLDVTGSARISDAIAIGTTPDTNNPFKILKNINATVGIKFENTNTSSSAFSAVQLGTDVTGGTKFTNLVYASSGISANGVYNPDGTSLINNGNGGLNFLGNPIRMYTGGSNGVLRWDLVSDGYITHYSATAPTTSATDSYRQYSADVTAGNAAPHFRTENGAVIKLYQETTAVGNSIISLGGGNSVLDDTTFDGYTLRQIVKALRNQGILA